MKFDPPPRPKSDFHFWWFVTRRCNNHCPHCLRYDIGDQGEELDARTAKRLLLEYGEYLRAHGKTSSIAFGGANPICREDLPDLLNICRDFIEKGIFVKPVGILANPQGVDLAYAKMMKECGIERFTVSIDGLKATNDAMRGEGNFDAAIACLDVLAEAGIYADVKFTAIRKTYKEYAAVCELVAKHGVTKVMPGRLILEGGGKAMKDEALTDEEWEAFLKANDIEMPRFPPNFQPSKLPNFQTSHFVIMAGGEIRPNRRGPALGHWPEESLEKLIAKLNEVE